ncbi:MAG TPA: hypothetical protein VFT45_08810 [Longimicrobium sp.]|nr:hypothetical protein [Longimicrobium sp.]
MPTIMIRPVCVVLAAGCLAATPLSAQLGFLGRVRQGIDRVTGTVQEARDVMCEVQRACGTVQRAEHFAPASYESVAVTTFDGTHAFVLDGALGQVRDAFEGTLVRGGFLLAANSNPQGVEELAARGEGNWSQEALAQLRQFINGVDAVIVVHIRRLDVGRCETADGSRGHQATVHLAVRWLNADAGDVPWVATHRATTCASDLNTAATQALQSAAAQLAASLPLHTAAP